jgi:hypothetical protein
MWPLEEYPQLTREQAEAAILIRQDTKSLYEGLCSIEEFFRRLEGHSRVLRGEGPATTPIAPPWILEIAEAMVDQTGATAGMIVMEPNTDELRAVRREQIGRVAKDGERLLAFLRGESED